MRDSTRQDDMRHGAERFKYKVDGYTVLIRPMWQY
jgi:hypothetical protein